MRHRVSNRPSLVQKVTTIIKNIKKQDIEIAKIVRDARAAELQVAEERRKFQWDIRSRRGSYI